MRALYLFLALILQNTLFAHGHHENANQYPLRQWVLPAENKKVEASLLMFKDGDVYLEKAGEEVVHFPLSSFSQADQEFVSQKYQAIEKLNAPLPASERTRAASAWWIFGLSMFALPALLFFMQRSRKRRYWPAFAGLAVAAGLMAFKPVISEKLMGTDPAFIDAAFAPYKPAVHTYWDNNYFYVESKGIGAHQMMVGITGWQQQVPIPQCYIGNNAWPIPLNPVIAAVPVPVSPQHFIRGAVAVAANGVPIFNPYTNTGVDALLDGQLDHFGGHSGRGDDYHYHIAPLHLDGQTSEVLPIAFALDGFAVYGSHEPDGSAMAALDANHGHYGADGVYHYHGTANAPYMIGNMVGQVTEDNTLQIIPQAHANPVRPATTPLQGAVITDFQSNGANGYILTYTKSNQTYKVDYSWTPNGVYTFNFISPTGTTTSVYNGFQQCQVPVGINDPAFADAIVVAPNPAAAGFSLLLNGNISAEGFRSLTLYSMDGKAVFQTTQFEPWFNVSQCPSGVYLLKLELSEGTFTRKLLMQ